MLAVRTKQRYKFGVKIPRGEREARIYDDEKNNKLWNEAITKELDQVILEYETFRDKGKFVGKKQVPKARLNMVFGLNHDLRHKMRLVAGRHLTDPSGDTSYSSVASLRSIRIANKEFASKFIE